MTYRDQPEWRELGTELSSLPGVFLHSAPPAGQYSLDWPNSSHDVLLLIEALEPSTDENLSKRARLQRCACDCLIASLKYEGSSSVDVWNPVHVNSIKERGALFVLDPNKTDRFTVGRGLNSTIILEDVMISTKHLTVSWSPKQIRAFIGRVLRKVSHLTPDVQNFPDAEFSPFHVSEETGTLFDEQIFTNTDSSLNGTYLVHNSGQSKKLTRDKTTKFCLKDTFSAGIPTVADGVHSFLAQFSLSFVSRLSPIVFFLAMLNDLKGAPIKSEPGRSSLHSPLLRSLHNNQGASGGPHRRATVVHKSSPIPSKRVEPYTTDPSKSSPAPAPMRSDDTANGTNSSALTSNTVRVPPGSSREAVRMRNQIIRNEKEIERLNAELRKNLSELDSMESECHSWQCRAEENDSMLIEIEEMKSLIDSLGKEVATNNTLRAKAETELQQVQVKLEVVMRERDVIKADFDVRVKLHEELKQTSEETQLKLTLCEAARSALTNTNAKFMEESKRSRETLLDIESSIHELTSDFQADMARILQPTHSHRTSSWSRSTFGGNFPISREDYKGTVGSWPVSTSAPFS
eukprot:GHVH01006990.1.p1 GENE.GHVH01006990.1~~GHVH01006990.1.p1  ORF type:complete len:575 (+),score=69.48 GHVH01006990.1:43-1767(+)